MKRRAVLLLLAALAIGCGGGAVAASEGWRDQFNTDIGRWHDPELPVTCWTARQYGTGGIAMSCLPDSTFEEVK